MASKTFAGKVAIVTGSSSGIGEFTAIRFASMGASVVITGRNGANLEIVRQRCAAVSSDDHVLVIVADLKDDETPGKIINETIAKFGRLDVLVNNAGVYTRAKLSTPNLMSIFDDIYATDLRAVLYLCHLALPHLEKTKGNIVNVSSIGGMRPWMNGLVYNSAKAAVDMVTRCLALELGPKGIRVNNVNPAVIRTPIFDTYVETKEEVDAIMAEVAKTYPLGRYGEPEEVAKSITFLASDDASFISGHLLLIDGACIDAGDNILPGSMNA
ncbi:Glucose 1-dehydrogenase [Halotydeus destructor]|nr:Glucose 1-dehydrogenase [Halotydeus destructor]